MKVAFVGKGGSGKTTICAGFANLIEKKKLPLVVFDADINMHLNLILGIKSDREKIISREKNVTLIREYLKGTNSKILSSDHFVKTTPPGIGSSLISINKENSFLQRFGTPYSGGFFFEVGTYEKDGIGTSCYHTNLSVLENVLTHIKDEENQWVVIDMVAGTDAFSNTLHLAFDKIIFVLEATQESITVYKKYLELAKHAGIKEKIIPVLNKFEEGDLEYLETHDIKVAYKIPYSREIRATSQEKKEFPEVMNDNLEKLYQDIKDQPQDKEKFLQQLHELHESYSSQDYITKTIGNLSNQIDKNFSYE